MAALAAARRPSLDQPVAGVARLSKTSHVPLYYQLAVILENRVAAGDYAPGRRFPSEHELCVEFGISRAVVRPAIAILEREGRLERIKGLGTFVRPPKAMHTLGGLTRIVACDEGGRGAELEVIEVRDGEPQSEIEQVLGSPGATHVRRVTAVLRDVHATLALYWSFVSPEVGWAEGLEQGSVVAVDGLACDVELTSGDCVVESSWSTDFESARLGIPGGTPILVAHCTEIGHRPGDLPAHAVEVAWVMCRADAMRVRMQLGPC